MLRRRRLGADLRRLREAAGLTGEQVIARVGWASASKLSRLENGRSRPDLADVLDLLDTYGVDGPERDELVGLARDAGNTRGWLREYPVMTHRQRAYAELESSCLDIREYAPAIVPGLLQTEGYAWVRILSSQPLQDADASRADPEAEVKARMARQKILNRDVDPPRYEAVLDEAALVGRGGSAEVLAEQLEHLNRLAQLPNVTLRVLTRESTVGESYLPHTAFSIYRFADSGDPETVAVEALAADIVLTDKPDVARYTTVFDWLREAALSPDLSQKWLAEAAHAGSPPRTPARPAPRPRRSESSAMDQ